MILQELLNKFNVENEEGLIEAKTNKDSKQTRELVTGCAKAVNMTADHCKRLCDEIGLEYLDGYESRVLEYTVTNESVDRAGDIIRAKGVDFITNYYPKNPVVFFCHDTRSFPIANSVKIRYDAPSKSIIAKALFLDDRVDKTGAADTAFRFGKSGAMKACSIGFGVLEYNYPKNPDERRKLGLGEYGVEFLKTDMREFSPCGVPCNPTALRKSIEDNQIDFKVFDKGFVDRVSKLKIFEDNALDIFSEHVKGIGKKKTFEMPDFNFEINIEGEDMENKDVNKETPETNNFVVDGSKFLDKFAAMLDEFKTIKTETENTLKEIKSEISQYKSNSDSGTKNEDNISEVLGEFNIFDEN